MLNHDSKKNTLSPRELELMAMAMQCVVGDITIDQERFAELAGLKKSSATVIWGRLKRKFRAIAADKTNDDPQAVGMTEDDEAEDVIKQSPLKKRKANHKADAKGATDQKEHNEIHVKEEV